ncbi:MAG TPA: hypothetical protein VF779_20940 [Pyrinomonadaceae bacterium]
MKLIVRLFLTLAVCSMVVPATFAKKRPLPPAANIAGIYENFTVGKQSGDLEGMRVVIVAAGGAYHAIVQIAQGGAEDPAPEFVNVTVKGMNVSFTASASSTTYTGTVTVAGLRIKGESGPELLKRQSCTTYFNMGP